MKKPQRKALYTESVHVKLSKELLSECWVGASQLGIGLSDYIRLSIITHVAGMKAVKL